MIFLFMASERLYFHMLWSHFSLIYSDIHTPLMFLLKRKIIFQLVNVKNGNSNLNL